METRLSQLHTTDAKEREIRKYSKTESQHLRLRRTKIKLSDFRTVKVIGKGAFGEVSTLDPRTCCLVIQPTRLGAFGAESGYWESVCHEKFTKGRDVRTRSGQIFPGNFYPELNL